MKMIDIETKPFGKIKVDQDEVIHFPEGILAFEDFKNYILLSEFENKNFHWLQSLDEPSLAFLVIKITDLMAEYEPKIGKADLKVIGYQEDQPIDQVCDFWGIVTIPQDQPEMMTVNLQGPVIIHSKVNKGGQFVSNDDNHLVRAKILDLIEREAKC